LHTASAAATSAAVDGRAITLPSAPTSPSSAQIIANGHQSRLASASSVASVVTDGQTDRSRSSTASSTSTRGARR
jgi:hypothetical protein